MRKLTLPQNFRPGRFDVTGTHSMMFSPGVYRVPDDMSDELATRAVKEANASWVEEAAEPKRKMKGESPENKSR